MTREDVIKNFPDATSEQVTSILNAFHSELSKEKEKSSNYKQLQEEFARVNEENATNTEKATKQEDMILSLQKELKTMKRQSELAKLGIVGEDASKLFLDNGDIDFSVLGNIITSRENSAKSQKEQELLQNTPNPNGANNEPEIVPNDVANAQNIVFGGISNNAQNTRDLYK